MAVALKALGPDFAEEIAAVPHDFDAEEVVLRCLLDPTAAADLTATDPELVPELDERMAIAAQNVAAEDFMSPAHGAIFEAILALHERRVPLSAVTLARELRATGKWKALGAEPALMLQKLAGGWGTTYHLTYYAAMVRDLAVKRRGGQIATQILQTFYDPAKTGQQALGLAHDLLDGIGARFGQSSGVFEVAQLHEKLHDLYRNGVPKGWEPEWMDVAKLYRPEPGYWTVLTGIPGHGKSAWLDALMVSLAALYGLRFAVCSPEMQPLERHMAKIAQLSIGKPFYQGPTQRMTEAELDGAEEWGGEHFTFVLPHESQRSPSGIIAAFEGLLQRKQIDGVVIDPWNELDHNRPSGMTETEFISQSLTKFRNFARRWKVHLWLVAHPTKIQSEKDSNTYRVPTLYDISGSAHWRNKTDNGVVVYRNYDKPGLVEIHVQKVRFEGASGELGLAELSYDRITGRYSSI